MKRILIMILMAASAMATQAQTDSAAIIVDRFVSILNMKMLPTDSMVVVTSIQVDRNNPKDTIIMRRWVAYPNKSRSEVWYGKKILDGFVSDGMSQHMFFDTTMQIWRNTTHVQYLDNQAAYDVRGPFHNWRTQGVELRYNGEKQFQGHPVYAVEVELPNTNNREYFFEKETGMLFLYRVLDQHTGDSVKEEYKTDWRAYHEYQEKGACIFPKVESYQNQGHIYIIHHKVEFRPIDDRVFKQTEEQRKRWE